MIRRRQSPWMVYVTCLALQFLATPFASAVIVQLQGTGLPTDPSFTTTPMPPNPVLPGLTFSRANLNTQYTNILGAPSPNKLPELIWGESQTQLFMTLTSDGSVDVYQTLKFSTTGDYWTVQTELVFNPATAVVIDPNDELSMKGYLQHLGVASADGIPHPQDDKAGPAISYSLVINAGNKVPVQNPLGGTSFAVATSATAQATHPHGGHRDVLLGAMAANVKPDTNAQISFIDDIEGFWVGGIGGHHLVPEPASTVLLGTGLTVLFMTRRRNSARKKAH